MDLLISIIYVPVNMQELVKHSWLIIPVEILRQGKGYTLVIWRLCSHINSCPHLVNLLYRTITLTLYAKYPKDSLNWRKEKRICEIQGKSYELF